MRVLTYGGTLSQTKKAEPLRYKTHNKTAHKAGCKLPCAPTRRRASRVGRRCGRSGTCSEVRRMGTRCRLLFGATDGAPTSAEEWFVCFHTSGVSPILGTDGPAPAGRSFPLQSQRSHCAINSLAVLAGAPRTVAVCSCGL